MERKREQRRGQIQQKGFEEAGREGIWVEKKLDRAEKSWERRSGIKRRGQVDETPGLYGETASVSGLFQLVSPTTSFMQS